MIWNDMHGIDNPQQNSANELIGLVILLARFHGDIHLMRMKIHKSIPIQLKGFLEMLYAP